MRKLHFGLAGFILLAFATQASADTVFREIPQQRWSLSKTSPYPGCPFKILDTSNARAADSRIIKERKWDGGMDALCNYNEPFTEGFSKSMEAMFYAHSSGIYTNVKSALNGLIADDAKVLALSGFEESPQLSNICDKQVDVFTNADKYDLDVINHPEKIRESRKADCRVFVKTKQTGNDMNIDYIYDDVRVYNALKIKGWVIATIAGGKKKQTEDVLGMVTIFDAEQMPQPDWVNKFISRGR